MSPFQGGSPIWEVQLGGPWVPGLITTGCILRGRPFGLQLSLLILWLLHHLIWTKLREEADPKRTQKFRNKTFIKKVNEIASHMHGEGKEFFTGKIFGLEPQHYLAAEVKQTSAGPHSMGTTPNGSFEKSTANISHLEIPLFRSSRCGSVVSESD